MESIVVYSKNKGMLENLEKMLDFSVPGGAEVHFLNPPQNLLEFLQYEIPELVILHFNPLEDDFRPLFDQLDEDPWLESIGFVCVWPKTKDEVIEEYRHYNISYFLEEDHLDKNLPKVLQILGKNRDLLNHSEIIQKITSLSGELILDTDLLLIPFYAAFFSHFLYRGAYVSWEKKYALRLALTEFLINAMEHGNAGITFEEKTRIQDSGGSLKDWIDERLSQSGLEKKKVILQYSISHGQSRFTITDEGNGFDVDAFLNRHLPLDSTHGRGIMMSRSSVDKLEYNAKGNQVSFLLKHDGTAERAIPTGFIETPPLEFEPGRVIFRENDSTDFLYYIVSGEYQISIKGRDITILTSQDIFMGEMSFLLGNRRSATVTTLKKGKLVPIDRKTFTQTVKSYPNYAIFLSKLLARRLKEANLRFVGFADYVP